MYANSEDFQVLAITTMVSSFVAEWNDRGVKLQSDMKGEHPFTCQIQYNRSGRQSSIAKATDDCRCVYDIPLFQTS